MAGRCVEMGVPVAIDAASVTYSPEDDRDWNNDVDPGDLDDALDQLGITRAVRITGTEPDDKIVGMLWLDTSVSSAAGDIVAVTTKTAAYTALDTDHVILCDGTFTVTLPASAGRTGRMYYIKNIAPFPNVVTIDANANELIDGGLTAVLTSQYMSLTIVCDGSNWHLL